MNAAAREREIAFWRGRIGELNRQAAQSGNTIRWRSGLRWADEFRRMIPTAERRLADLGATP